MLAFEPGRELAFVSGRPILPLPMHVVYAVHPPMQIKQTLAVERGWLLKICGAERLDDSLKKCFRNLQPIVWPM